MVLKTEPKYIFQPAQNFTFAAQKDASISLAELQMIQLRSQFASVMSTVAEYTKAVYGPNQFNIESSPDLMTVRNAKDNAPVLALGTQADKNSVALFIKEGDSKPFQVARLGLNETALSAEKINEIFGLAGAILVRSDLDNAPRSSVPTSRPSGLAL